MSDFGDFLDAVPYVPNVSSNTPPGTTGSDFLSYLDQPEQMTGVARAAALPASNLAKGFGTALGLPGDIQALRDQGVDWLLRHIEAIGRGVPVSQIPTTLPDTLAQDRLPSSADILAKGRAVGIVDRADLAPQSEGERAVAAASQGVGSALPYAALGGAPAVLPAIVGGAGGGLGSMYGERAGESLGYPKTGAILGGLAGGITGGLAASGGVKGLNAALGNYGEEGQAYRTAGVPLNFTPNEKAAAYSSQSLGGSARTQSLAKQEVTAFGNAVEDTASSLGNSTTLQELGDTAQAQGKQWLSTFKQQSGAAHSAVDQAVGPDAPVQLTATNQVLSDIAASGGGNQAATAFLKSGLTKNLEGIVSSTQSAAIPWQTARALRSRIGEYLENPDLIADAGTAQAKRLYGALTDDLRGTAAASFNQNALPLFDLASTYTRQGHDFIDNVLSPIMNKDAPGAARSILSSANNGAQMVGPLRQNMPGLADEIAAFKLRDMAAATAGQQNATGSAISPGSFLTDWNRLSPEAKSALYSDPQVASKIDALAKISENVKARQALLNTSKTAHHGALTAMALTAAEGARTGYEAGGLPGAFGGAAMGGAVLPAFNYAYSLLGANRPLARLMAAQGPPTFTGQGGLLGMNAGVNNVLGQVPSGLLRAPGQ